MLKPIYSDKYGDCFSAKDVRDYCVRMAIKDVDKFITTRNKYIVEETMQAKKVENLIDESAKSIGASIERLMAKEQALVDSTKSISQSVRKSTNDMANGLERITKQADFNKLERYVELLERASAAISAMAEIEKSGKLEKIASALK